MDVDKTASAHDWLDVHQIRGMTHVMHSVGRAATSLEWLKACPRGDAWLRLTQMPFSPANGNMNGFDNANTLANYTIGLAVTG